MGKTKKTWFKRYRKFILYPIVTATFVLFATAILVLANGFLPTITDGHLSFVKTGMLIVATRPSGAEISLDGKAQQSKTSYYLFASKIANLLPGEVDLKVTKPGYRTWEKRVEILPSMVTWANYILLFPQNLKVNTTDKIVGTYLGSSQNGRELLFSEILSGVFSLRSYQSANQNFTTLWPSDVSTALVWLKNPKILSASYNSSSDRALLAVDNAGKTEYVVTDGNGVDTKLIAINDQYKIDPDGVRWNPFDSAEVYLSSKGSIYRRNIKDTGVGNPIADSVVSFSIEKNRQIYYVMKSKDNVYSLEKMNIDGTGKQNILEPIAASKSYSIVHSSDNDAVAVLNKDTSELILVYPSNGNKMTTLKLASHVKDTSWSQNGQKLLYYTDHSISRYDFDKKKENTSDVSQLIGSAGWYFDDCHFLIRGDKSLVVTDYDGTNPIEISSAKAADAIVDTQTNNILFDLSKETNKFSQFVAEF